MTPADRLDIEDPAAMAAYLRTAVGRAIDPASIRVLAGGVSNKTVRAAFADGTCWVFKQALSQLRVEQDWHSDPARIYREAEALRAFHRLAPDHVPDCVFEDRPRQVLGMTEVPAPHDNLKALLLRGEIHPRHVERMAGLLALLQVESTARQATLSIEFADRTFFESLRIEPYFRHTGNVMPAAAVYLNDVVGELMAHREVLVHGDYSPKNLLVHDGRLFLIDFEVAHWGDASFDPSFALTHLLSKARFLIDHRDAFLEAAMIFWSAYGGGVASMPWSRGLEERVVRTTLGLLLARAMGRSPLEYLTRPQRERQAADVLDMLTRPPARVSELIASWGRGLKGTA